MLHADEEFKIIKAAPTYKPQIQNSHQRLMQLINGCFLRHATWSDDGGLIGFTHEEFHWMNRRRARIQFLSANPQANIVGATASLLLEIDEAQDIEHEKYDRDLRPMASTMNATILYGTAWSDKTLLARVRAQNLELEHQDGIKRHFEYDWRTLAKHNENYKIFVEGEIKRLGKDHPSVRTQYCLLELQEKDTLLGSERWRLLLGTHEWLLEADPSECYIAGMDIGGEESRDEAQIEAEGAPKRDSTVLTIGKVTYNDDHIASLEIVHQYWWTGMKYSEQLAKTIAIGELWNIRRIMVDSTGLGAMLCASLAEKWGKGRVGAYQFNRKSKSELAYHMLSMIETERLKIYQRESAPQKLAQEFWEQLRLVKYQLWPDEVINIYIDPVDGHDDFIMSLALCCEGVKELVTPLVKASIIHARQPTRRRGRTTTSASPYA